MNWKMAMAPNRAIYKMRKAVVEPVFGQIKEARGFRQFSFRGMEAVGAEWSLICLVHNLLKLFRHQRAGPATVWVAPQRLVVAECRAGAPPTAR